LKALKYLIRAERNRQCYAKFRHHTKPKSAGGLAFVTVTKADGTKQPLLDKTELEDTLLEHSRAHFAQADGSRFTQEPLKHLLCYNGLTTFGNHVTQGKPLPEFHNFDEPTTAVLTNLKRKVTANDTMPITLDYDSLLCGIQKWPERTTTSPSGRHLGIYKSLGKHVVQKKKTNSTNPEPTQNNEAVKQGRDVLFLIFDIMTLAVKHAYPLQ